MDENTGTDSHAEFPCDLQKRWVGIRIFQILSHLWFAGQLRRHSAQVRA